MKTLRQRLTFTHTIVALLAVLVMALLASLLIIRAYGRVERSYSRTIAERVSQFLGLYYARHDGWQTIVDDIQIRIEQQPITSGRRIVLSDHEWNVILDTAHKLDNQKIPIYMRPLSVPVLVHDTPDGIQLPRTEVQPPPAPPFLSEEQPLRFSDRRANRHSRPEYIAGFVTVPVGVGSRSAEDEAFLRNITFIVIVGSLVAGSVALGVALIMAKQVTTPLNSLTLAARRLASGERHQPLDVPADEELAELSQAFNTMAAELAHQEDIRRQLTADVAHELRTPLSVLQLQIESLEDGIEQPTPELFGSLRQEVVLLSRLVEDLRLLSLAEAGRLHLSIENLDPHEVLNRASSVVAPLARQHNITLQLEDSEPLPPLRADPQRLQQVLRNLLENALHYTPAGGNVVLRAQSLPNGPDSDGISEPHILLEVADSGAGIAPADLPYIFNRFYRTDRARTRETGGSGLGLAIVQRLVEAQGGEVSVESQEGQGTTFRVVLPAGEEGMMSDG
jgi:signal transduction histidine kinase